MNSRRQFLKHALAASSLPALFAFAPHTLPKPKKCLKPPALQPGDTIGLVAPASVLFETHRTLIEATEKIRGLGFKVKIGANVSKRYGYLAGSIRDRVDDLHRMFEDDSVKAIMAIRGGYGSAQLLPHLDYGLIRKHPKILIGYSDITALITGVQRMTGLVTFHGPVAVSTFTDYTRKYLLQTLGSTSAIGEIDDAPYEDNLQVSNRVWTLRGGTAEGKLVGGNLTLLQASLGTPYEFDSREAIIFIEEVGEEPYDLDRMLTQMQQAGKFDRCRGVFIDKLGSVKPASYKPGFYASLSVEQVLENIFKDFDFPVCIGISIGHVKDKPTLPIGIRARLNADRGRVALLEAAVD